MEVESNYGVLLVFLPWPYPTLRGTRTVMAGTIGEAPVLGTPLGSIRGLLLSQKCTKFIGCSMDRSEFMGWVAVRSCSRILAQIWTWMCVSLVVISHVPSSEYEPPHTGDGPGVLNYCP